MMILANTGCVDVRVCLRSVPAEDKSFAVGVQCMLFRVLGES